MKIKMFNSKIEYKNGVEIKQLYFNSLLPSVMEISLLFTALLINFVEVGLPTMIETKNKLHDFLFSKLYTFLKKG